MQGSRRSHGSAVALMVLVTLLWSSAGVVTRQLDSAGGFELTFWRSVFTAVSLAVYYAVVHGRRTLPIFKSGGAPMWMSGALWSVMFTCFMVALSLTTVANVLITMSLSPLFTAVLARFTLGHRLAPHTWVAIVLAGIGIGWMYGQGVSADPRHLLGTLVALGVPVAAAINWNVLQRSGASVDLVPALMIGAVISSLAMLPLAFPAAATPSDIVWLAALGLFQLAIPCILAVRLARKLPAPELALLSLLEIVFGIAWAWTGANEAPSPHVLAGGALVLCTLAANELWSMRGRSLASMSRSS